ncbi:hypothetical protein Cgig2_007619 [Carnegiea gigantea]|uniref:Uncharacterized protein n=1 Tax=Carnegiea gigantea TaxID=171969 RepID=A0A9Q1JJN0_9CARY|nr:hypothetical protein Cgig2_007619 [Carnegiea gigantea]
MATSIIKGKQDPLVTAIIPRQVTLDDAVKVALVQSVPTTIESLFVNSIEECIHESVLSGVKAVVDMISNKKSTQALLPNRVRVFQSLKILHSMVDKSHLSIVEISWLTYKVQEAFNVAEIWIPNGSVSCVPKILFTPLKLLTCKTMLKSYLVRLCNLNLGRRRS